MDKIHFKCTECDSEIEVPDMLAGKTMTCDECNCHLNIPLADIVEGMIIGDFTLVKKLGVGGMGEVWLANQTVMDRKVALKILSPALTKDADFINRFKKEVITAARLEHPNIVGAFHAGESEEGMFYLAISFVDGEELGERLKREGFIDEKEALKIIRDIAKALEYAWDSFQILHRDIKPANIMLEKTGVAKLMDMGIAKSLSGEDSSLTMTGVIVGTPNYISPEQARGQLDIDFRSDIYALGATLFELVTGQVPFDAPTPMGIITKHLTEVLPSPHLINSNVSKQCDSLINIMMSKEAENRQDSWGAVISQIDLVLEGKYPSSKKNNNSKLFVNIVSILILIIAVALFVNFRLLNEPIENIIQEPQNVAVEADLIDENIAQVANKLTNSENSSVSGFADSGFDIKKSRNKKCKKQWDLIMTFMEENPEDFKTTITMFEDIKNNFPDTEYNMKANIEIGKLNKQRELLEKNKQDEENIRRILKELKIHAENFATDKEYLEAAKVYSNYNDSYIEETQNIRNKEEKKYLELYENLKEEKQKATDLENKHKEIMKMFADKLENLLLAENFKDVIAHLAKNKENPIIAKEFEKLYAEQNIFEILANKESLFINYLKKNIRKEVTIGEYTGVIDKVSDTYLMMKIRVKKGSEYTKKITYKKISAKFKTELFEKLYPKAFVFNKVLIFINDIIEKEEYLKLEGFFNKNSEFVKYLPKLYEKYQNSLQKEEQNTKLAQVAKSKEQDIKDANEAIVKTLEKFGCTIDMDAKQLVKTIIHKIKNERLHYDILQDIHTKIKIHEDKYKDIAGEVNQQGLKNIKILKSIIQKTLEFRQKRRGEFQDNRPQRNKQQR